MHSLAIFNVRISSSIYSSYTSVSMRHVTFNLLRMFYNTYSAIQSAVLAAELFTIGIVKALLMQCHSRSALTSVCQCGFPTLTYSIGDDIWDNNVHIDNLGQHYSHLSNTCIYNIAINSDIIILLTE